MFDIIQTMSKNDGLLVFKGKKQLSEIKSWSYDFQAKVNKLSGNEYLQYTCEIWILNVGPLIKKTR